MAACIPPLRILPSGTRRSMTRGCSHQAACGWRSRRQHRDDPAVRYGFGWRITGETLWHSGETVGFRNVIIRYPRRHFTVIVLTNRDAPEPYALALAIAKLYVPEAHAERAAGSPTGPDPRARPLPPQAQ